MTEKKKVSFKKVLGFLGLVAGGFAIGALVQKRVDVVDATKNGVVKLYGSVSSGIKKLRAPKAEATNVKVPVYNDAPRNNKFNN